MCTRTRAVLLALPILAVALAGWLAPAGGAKSNRVRIGHLSPPYDGGCFNCNAFQISVAEGSPSYRVPKGRWTLVKWRTRGSATEEGLARMRVWRETNVDGRYRLIGQSAEKTVGADTAPRFGAQIKVRRGDLLGMWAISGIATGYTSVEADDVSAGAACFKPGGVGDSVGTGTSCPISPNTHSLGNVTATLKRR
jgi:hypothetical protein